MGYSTKKTGGTERVLLVDPDYWVDIRTCMTRGALAKAETAMSRTAVTPGNSENDTVVAMSPDVAGYRNLMVLGSIVAWNIDDDNGRVLEINLENIELLTGPDFDRVYARVNDLNSPMKGEEAKRFPDQVAGSDLP